MDRPTPAAKPADETEVPFAAEIVESITTAGGRTLTIARTESRRIDPILGTEYRLGFIAICPVHSTVWSEAHRNLPGAPTYLIDRSAGLLRDLTVEAGTKHAETCRH